MFWLRTANWLRVGVVLMIVAGCEAPPPPEQVVNPPPQPQPPANPDPVHFAEDRLRSPLLEGLRQQIENSETDETRQSTSPLRQQLASADEIMSEARQKNRAAIQQANRQVRMGTARQSPSLVVLTVDRMGVADLSTAGQTHWQTPALDRLAANGLRFSRCYSGLNPTSSRSSLLTGHFNPVANSARAAVMLPKILWNAGYKTALIGEWPRELSPASLGYEESSGWNVAPDRFPDGALLNGKRISLENNSAGKREISKTDFLISEVRSFLRDAQVRPQQFFLHVSIRVFDDLADRSLSVADYASRIQEVDTATGRVLDALDEFGLGNRTCVWFLSLAGPLPALTDLIRETRSVGDLAHSKTGLKEGNLRVPLIVSWPGQISAGAVSETISGPCDHLPTLAQLACVSRPIGRVDGNSLLEVLRHNSPIQERRIVWQADDGRIQAVLEKNWKAVAGDANQFQLFDLNSDPAEENDVAAGKSDVLRRLIGN